MWIRFVLLAVSAVVLAAACVFTGSVSIPAAEVWRVLSGHADPVHPFTFIVMESRLPQAAAALLAGAALAVSGLLLQNAFRNPLAGPSVLGVNSGASLGVALVMLATGGAFGAGAWGWAGQAAVLAGAFGGSLGVMALLLLLSVWLRNDLMLLIAGMMLGYLVSSVITLLSYFATAEGLQGYTMWGMGSFGGVTRAQLPVFAALVCAGLALSAAMVKPLNIIQLGDNYASSLGVSMHRVRNMLLCATGLLAAAVTAYCGPVSFIGLAVPHMARMVFRTSDQRVMVPGCMLCGAVTGLLCNWLCTALPGNSALPLNSVTPLIGVPVILYVILKERRRR